MRLRREVLDERARVAHKGCGGVPAGTRAVRVASVQRVPQPKPGASRRCGARRPGEAGSAEGALGVLVTMHAARMLGPVAHLVRKPGAGTQRLGFQLAEKTPLCNSGSALTLSLSTLELYFRTLSSRIRLLLTYYRY